MAEIAVWPCSCSGCWGGPGRSSFPAYSYIVHILLTTCSEPGSALGILPSLCSDHLVSLNHWEGACKDVAFVLTPGWALAGPGSSPFVRFHMLALSSVLVCLLNALVTLLINHSAGISNLGFKLLFTVCNYISVWFFN